jgi:hypothetical protein
MRKTILQNTPRREKVDAVAKIVKRVCGVSQSDAFNIAKQACVFSIPKRSAGSASGEGK